MMLREGVEKLLIKAQNNTTTFFLGGGHRLSVKFIAA